MGITNLPQRIRDWLLERRISSLQAYIKWLDTYEACANQPCFDTYCKVAHLEQQLARMKGRGE